jgi:hypothetical protein
MPTRRNNGSVSFDVLCKNGQVIHLEISADGTLLVRGAKAIEAEFPYVQLSPTTRFRLTGEAVALDDKKKLTVRIDTDAAYSGDLQVVLRDKGTALSRRPTRPISLAVVQAPTVGSCAGLGGTHVYAQDGIGDWTTQVCLTRPKNSKR